MKAAAVSRRTVRIGAASTFSAAGEILDPAERDLTIDAEAIRIGWFSYAWKIMPKGQHEPVFASGTARTEDGAFQRATRAAHRPGLGRGAR